MHEHTKLRKRRMMAGLTQCELATLARVERSRLSMYENGHLKISAQECAAVARALRCALQRRAREFQEELAIG